MCGGLSDTGEFQSIVRPYTLPTLMSGLVWARKFKFKRRMQLDGILFIAGVPMWIIGINHESDLQLAWLGFVAISIWILSIGLMFMAENQLRRDRRMRPDKLCVK